MCAGCLGRRSAPSGSYDDIRHGWEHGGPSGGLLFCSSAGAAQHVTLKRDGEFRKIEQPSTRAFRGRCKERVPGCQVARRCDRSKIPRLDLGFKVPFVSMQSKCYEAGHQQRCAGHDEAHCHSGSSCMMQGSMRRAFLRRPTRKFQGYRRNAGRPSAVKRPAVAENFNTVATRF